MIRAGLVGPFGPVALVEREGVLVGLEWRLPEVAGRTVLLAEGLAQLAAYFAGRLKRFDLPMDWGAGLNASVRRAMADIPYGETRTYGQIAKLVGAAPQAVGQACGANPLPILIPCHRVVAANGHLTGYLGEKGIQTKKFLLELEGHHIVGEKLA